ncbi:hypothetical protein IZ6_17010 [Terrihabitans soli]|uniref:PepSY domain-containing protein n=1 Tax=Terrihabitans soli TaxID=708113 RepID=A0A6S6QNH7_9HYPH|nr:PepSY domain-containing protein [Terrihabitans soli]BCJ90966.1 hypothetical protein IZ6_17010 [Terrihabitans soli]
MTKTALALAAALALTGMSQTALASANCTEHPKSEWLSEDAMKAKVGEMGYKIKVFKVSGDCYEIYGWTKDGRKAEIYFDTKTGDVVKSNID